MDGITNYAADLNDNEPTKIKHEKVEQTNDTALRLVQSVSGEIEATSCSKISADGGDESNIEIKIGITNNRLSSVHEEDNQSGGNEEENENNSKEASKAEQMGEMGNEIPSIGALDKSENGLLAVSHTKQRFSPITRQCATAFGSIMASLAAGLTSGYSAVLLPQLELPGSPIEINTETSSWIASIAALPMAPGCILGGWMMDRFGRKTSHLILSVPFVIGWMLISASQGLTTLLVGRFLTGLCVGILGPLCSVYIGEISAPKYRGFLLASVTLAVALGILLSHVIGTFLNWKITAAICSFVPFVCFVLMSFVPESPNWLLSKDQVEEAIKSFYWFRGYSDESTAELTALIEQHQSKRVSEKRGNQTLIDKLSILRGNFRKIEFSKPLVIMILFFVTSQFSGVNAVAFYSVSIMKKTIGEGLNEYTATLIIDVARLAVSILACVLLRTCGRRPLAFLSGITTTLSLIGLAIFLHATKNNSEMAAKLTWLPLFLLIMYICAISIGFVPLPWIMIGEVFPASLRGPGSGICTGLAFAAFFVVVKTTPAMFKNLGDGNTFLTYGIVSLVGTAILYFILPETKGKTLQEIEEHFKMGQPDKSKTPKM